MKIAPESHLDHGLTEAHVSFVREQFADRSAFFLETIVLPDTLPALECALHGPAMGDAPVPESEVGYDSRGERAWPSRLVNRPKRPTRQLTVIAGPHGDEACVLYTAFGGPSTPREPCDPTLPEDQRAASVAFWREHALTSEVNLSPNPDPDNVCAQPDCYR
jgi:hypothetical protein